MFFILGFSFLQINQATAYIPATTMILTNKTITFSTSGSVSPTSMQVSKTISDLPIPVFAGHRFLWWYTAITWWTQVVQNTTITQNMTLYARWQVQPTVIISFNANWWTFSWGLTSNSRTIPYGTPIAVRSIIPVRSWYDFWWWYTWINSGTQATWYTNFIINTSLYARWIQKPQNVSVTFHANWGTFWSGGLTSTWRTIPYNTTLPAWLIQPIKSWYVFVWWYTAIEWWYITNWTTNFTTNTFLYARWRSNTVVVTFNTNWGTFWTWGATSTWRTITFNSAVSSWPTAPIRSWYRFDWWYTWLNWGTLATWYSNFAINTTLYAHWSTLPQNVTIILNANGWSWSTTVTLPYNTILPIRQYTPIRPEYTFIWWYTQIAWWVWVTWETKHTQNATLYARWVANTTQTQNVTITFNANWWTWHSPATKTVTSNTAIGTLPSNPTKAWFTFNGWFTAITWWTRVIASTVMTSNKTYYAQWTANSTTYTVTFNANWWTWHSPATKNVTSNTAIGTLPSNPTKAWFTFNGWFTAITWWTQVIASTVITSNKTYYAKWTANSVTYTVTFNANWWTWHSPATKNVTSNTVIGTLPSNPTKAWFTFNGWFTAINWWTQVSTSTVIVSNKTYYAQWTTSNSYYNTIKDLYYDKINGLTTSKLTTVITKIQELKPTFETWSRYYLILDALEQVINDVINSRGFDINSLFE